MDRFFTLMTVEETLELLSTRWIPPDIAVEYQMLQFCQGRILGKDILSEENIPPYNRSTVDGYAVKAKDTFGATESLPALLEIVEDIHMGDMPQKEIGPGQAAKIATGGMMPEGADACSMLEHTETPDDTIVMVKDPVYPQENTVIKGEDIKKGELFLKKGTFLGPSEIGGLAALGFFKVPLFREPKIAVISSGDEIVSPKEEVHPGQIRDINSYSLAARIRSLGGQPVIMGIAKDEYGALYEKVKEGVESADIVLVSGGSSVGTRDVTAKVFADFGEVFIHGVSIRPGKPVVIASKESRLMYGLPGHPISALVTFDLFVKPALEKLLQIQEDAYRPTLTAKLSRNVGSAPGRQDHIQVNLRREGDEIWADPVLGKSSLINTMVKSQGEIVVPSDLEGLIKGSFVQVNLHNMRF